MDKLRDKARTLQPVVRVGKNGLTPGTIEEISKHLKKRHLVKIKLLRAFIEDHNREETARQMAAACNAQLIQVIGNVVVLYRK